MDVVLLRWWDRHENPLFSTRERSGSIGHFWCIKATNALRVGPELPRGDQASLSSFRPLFRILGLGQSAGPLSKVRRCAVVSSSSFFAGSFGSILSGRLPRGWH